MRQYHVKTTKTRYLNTTATQNTLSGVLVGKQGRSTIVWFELKTPPT
jgi:hypothetical protein